jgi:hemoglobin
MKDIENQQDIQLLVDGFYNKVKSDPLLSPIFENELKDWTSHLPKMYRFWGTLLLDEMSYKGNPFLVHVGLPVDHEHFDRWVALFTETVDAHFQGPIAERAKLLARTNAHIFETKLKRM